MNDRMTIACATCPVQSVGCADCMVTALLDPAALGEADLSPDLPTDRREREVLGRLVASGLVDAGTATRARARREPWSEWVAVRDAVG